MALTVPQPAVSQDGAVPGVLSAAKPIGLACTPTFADGSAIQTQHVSRSVYVLYRRPAGSALQAWDGGAKAWRAADPLPAGDPLFPGDGGGWKALVVPLGQKDGAGNPVFDPAASAAYSFACYFAATDAAGATQTGASTRSAEFTLLQPGQDHRGGLAISPDDPAKAERLEIFLRDASFTDRATVTLDSNGGYSVTVAAAGAVVELSAGGIVLTPPAGTTVRVDGQLEIVGSLSLNGVVTT
jgi:hypothetical protein